MQSVGVCDCGHCGLCGVGLCGFQGLRLFRKRMMFRKYGGTLLPGSRVDISRESRVVSKVSVDRPPTKVLRMSPVRNHEASGDP